MELTDFFHTKQYPKCLGIYFLIAHIPLIDTFSQKALFATRQLAKRQITWIRSWENYLKIGINEIKPLEDSVKKIISLL